jgi:dolichyldiphosphatase
MPSTHSTALGFYFAYMWPLLPLVSGAVWGERAAVASITALTLWSRVELGYHTVPQVVVGTTVGVICAVGWRALWVANPAIEGQLQALMDVVRDKIISFF